jgi:hypothetical protein
MRTPEQTSELLANLTISEAGPFMDEGRSPHDYILSRLEKCQLDEEGFAHHAAEMALGMRFVAHGVGMSHEEQLAMIYTQAFFQGVAFLEAEILNREHRG